MKKTLKIVVMIFVVTFAILLSDTMVIYNVEDSEPGSKILAIKFPCIRVLYVRETNYKSCKGCEKETSSNTIKLTKEEDVEIRKINKDKGKKASLANALSTLVRDEEIIVEEKDKDKWFE